MWWGDGGGWGGGGAITFNSACIQDAALLHVNFSSNKMRCYFKLTSCHIHNATLNQAHFM